MTTSYLIRTSEVSKAEHRHPINQKGTDAQSARNAALNNNKNLIRLSNKNLLSTKTIITRYSRY